MTNKINVLVISIHSKNIMTTPHIYKDENDCLS